MVTINETEKSLYVPDLESWIYVIIAEEHLLPDDEHSSILACSTTVEEWVKELISGKYRQGDGILKCEFFDEDAQYFKHCCLGILGECETKGNELLNYGVESQTVVDSNMEYLVHRSGI